MFSYIVVTFTVVLVCVTNGHNLSTIRDNLWPYDLSNPFSYHTPSPINIDSSKVRLVHLPTPLTLNIGIFAPTTITNDGTAVRIRPNSRVPAARLTGGILGTNNYVIEEVVYHWNGDYRSDASAQVDGVGSPLAIDVIYRNIKYPNAVVARHHRDGFVSIVINVIVAGQAPNPLFGKFQDILARIRQSGTSTTVETTLPDFLWFDQLATVNHYYAYPGSLHRSSGNSSEEYDSSTIIQYPRELAPFLSIPQFQSFLQLRNPNNTPLTSILPTYSRHDRPVIEVVGHVQTIRPIA